MNLLALYHQKKKADHFNQADLKGVVSVNGFSFDIRIVDNELYCNGLSLEVFFNECMLTVNEIPLYEHAISNWLIKSQVA